jgi:hypothetical protein
MKRLLTSIIIVSLVFIPFKTHAQEVNDSLFTDLGRSHTSYVAIKHLSESDILKGYADGSFKPNKLVNRAEALKIILSSSNVESPSENLPERFSDVPTDQWFAPFVTRAAELGIVNGNPDGSFTPAANVKRAAFMKMLLETNRFKKNNWEAQQIYADVPQEAWYNAYMNYAGKAGLIIKSADNMLYPDKELSRAEVAEIIYLMRLILNGKQTQFLVSQAEAHMAQIETYISTKQISSAKRASELGYDLTQQALSNTPDNPIVLGAAKIAKAYDLLVDAYIAGLKKDNDQARTLAEQTKVKATEAWEANNDTQPIAKHLKDRADEILSQL